MGKPIIDGERWIAERLAFLRAQLTGALSPAERQATEAEIEVLAKEHGLTPGGHRVSRFGRRIRGLLRR